MITDEISNTAKTIDDIYELVKWRYKNVNEQEVKNVIWMHWFYGTMDIIYRGNKLVACVRWNVSADFRTFEVEDLFINKGENGLRIIKHFIARNWHRFPMVQYVRFERAWKYPKRNPRFYSITRILLKEK